jgi:glycosyltransferase involved in cell wall biosynthesis
MPMKIINIGPYKVTFKGIETTLAAVRILKQKNLPVMLIRVAPHIEEHERNNPLIDKCYENIPPENLGELLRNSHVYISNSTEGEGFGLPAMEAIATGAIPILSSISSYKNFSKKKNFCFFVPEHNAEKTAETVEKIFTMSKKQVSKIRSSALAVAQNYFFRDSCARFEKILYSALHNHRK